MAPRREPAADDTLEAAERGIEWGAAILKARRLARAPHQLRRTLGGASRIPMKPGSREQETLFEGLRSLAERVGATWECAIEGAGNSMSVRLTEPKSKGIAWSHTGSAAQVLLAFEEWLWSSS